MAAAALEPLIPLIAEVGGGAAEAGGAAGAAGAAGEAEGGGGLGRLMNFTQGAGGHSQSVQSGPVEPTFSGEGEGNRLHSLLPKVTQ